MCTGVCARVCRICDRLSVLTGIAIKRLRGTYDDILTVFMLKVPLMPMMHCMNRLKILFLPNVFLAMRSLSSVRRRKHTEGDRYSGVVIQIG